LDSGATFNFVSGSLFQPDSYSRQLLDLASQRTTIETSGLFVNSLYVGENTYENVTFLVVDELRDDVILGLQWLRDSRATMDFTLGCVHHGVTDRSTSYWNREVHRAIIPTCQRLQNSTMGFRPHMLTISETLYGSLRVCSGNKVPPREYAS
jgi:hypothetical protein